MPRQYTPKVERTCHYCGGKFLVQPNQTKRGRGKYCCREHANLAKRISLDERFWPKVRKTEGCWIWEGIRTTSGYGLSSINGQTIVAHRISYMLRHGPIPDNMLVCHHCDNPLCVRPDHLFLGTPADNMMDKVHKGRQSRGMTSGRTHLTDDMIREIRASKETHGQAAKRFGVSASAIYRIRKRETWAHVEDTC